MSSPNRICLAASIAIALTASAAVAQTTRPVTTTTSPVTTTTNGPNLVGGCRGSNGSSCTASSETSGTTTFGTARSTTPGVTGGNPAGATGTAGNNTSSSGSAFGTNQTTVDPATTRPDSFGPGGAFDTTGTGTTSGAGATPGTGGTMMDANGNPALLPGSNGAVTVPENGPQPTPQQNVVVQQPAPVQARAATPLFDQAAREGRAKDARRRAQGDEPRVYGIAPRTNRDLTDQMPDDPIIRY